jgi:hypothetical protein
MECIQFRIYARKSVNNFKAEFGQLLNKVFVFD